MERWRTELLPTTAILIVTVAGLAFAYLGGSYASFVLAMVALTAIVGIGLNVLVGLVGQVSLGHVGFYAIGAYAVAILTLHGESFWLALPIAGLVAAAVGAVLALPALRVTGPYLAMVTIAFAFIVQHGSIEWRGLTGGANGLMGLLPPRIDVYALNERDMAALAVAVTGTALFLFQRLVGSGWGKGMVAVRDSEVAARSIGLSPVIIRTAAFTVSALLTGIAGGLFAPLMMFVAPDSFPFSQSILFLLAVVVGGAGWVFGPVVGAIIAVVLPELLSGLAEYRLLFFGGLLLVVLWIAPEGAMGTAARLIRRVDARSADGGGYDLDALLRPADAQALTVTDIGIAFGGLRAAHKVSFSAAPGRITSVIGPNGAGKTTVLNMIGGFYSPDAGSIRLGETELAGLPSYRIARAGIARTYQTTKLFGSMSVIDNVLVALRRGRLGNPTGTITTTSEQTAAEALLAFAGYHGALATPADDLAHVDRRLVEIARALATRPRVLLLDEPAAGLMRADKDALGVLLRRIAGFGIAVILVEHDMTLVMAVSDHIVVLDTGMPIAAGTPAAIRAAPQVLKAYLGDSAVRARPRKAALTGPRETVLSVLDLTAGYGAAPVLQDLRFDVFAGEVVAVLGANGAGKSTTLRALAGLLRPVGGAIVLNDERIETLAAHSIAEARLALVPEGRQVFPELSVRDNLLLGAHTRAEPPTDAEVDAILDRFPRLRERIDQRAGLLSGGEQQMIAVARGLMAKPRILLLDEPSLGLAPTMVNELFDIIAELRDEGVTILLVDQMAAAALTVADRGYVLQSGRFAKAGAAATLADDPELEAAYLGHVEAAQ